MTQNAEMQQIFQAFAAVKIERGEQGRPKNPETNSPGIQTSRKKRR